MILLEYEAKQLLQRATIPTPMGQVLRQTDDLPVPCVLKSQVPVGGRGKLGGVRVVQTTQEASAAIRTMMELAIKGHRPRTLLAEEVLDIDRELYCCLYVDRDKSTLRLIAHKNGGIEIESHESDEFWGRDIAELPDDRIGEALAEYYSLTEQTFVLQDLIKNLYHCATQEDATLIEINPLILTRDGRLVASDCKMELDDTARFHHPEWQFEQTAPSANFVTLNPHGTIATIANGAGLAMATVDAVASHDLTPANFLDIGGGANTESVLAAFRTIMNFPGVKGIIINIFAGITRCDEVARAIIAAREQLVDLPPLFIRLAGTNYDEAADLLAKHHIPILKSLDDCIIAAKETIA